MMTASFLEEGQTLGEGDILTLRVYATVAAKKAVVVKDDDLLTKKEMLHYHRAATATEIRTWFENSCVEKAFSQMGQEHHDLQVRSQVEMG